MTKLSIAVLALVGLGMAAPRFASAQTAAAPAGSGGERFADAAVAGLVAQARVRDWDIASNDSNADEIYAQLVSAGGKPVCRTERLLVDSEYETVQDCDVSATVAHLTVKINDIFHRSTAEVDVQGETACQARWLAVPLGRRQRAELWRFCQFKGVARP